MARSGTSLVGQLIKSSGQAVIFPEMSLQSTPALPKLLDEVRATLAAQKWRPFTEHDIEARIMELLRRIWAAGRDPEVHDDRGQRRFGLKQPHAEESAPELIRSLPAFPPQWVYTVRNPVDIYESTLRMASGGDVAPDQFSSRFHASLDAIDPLVNSGNGFIFQADRAASDAFYREQRSRDLFEFLDLDFGETAGSFVDRWPATNTSAGRNAGPLADAEIAERAETLAGLAIGKSLLERVRSLV